MNFGFPVIQKGKPALILAPMEGITDAVMRETLTEFGGYNHCVTEFTRVSHEVLPPKVFKREVPELLSGAKTLSGTPVQVQLLGGHPGRMAMTALHAVQVGASAIDLNFGCPAPCVNRNDGGASLLRDPKRLEEIVREVRQALPAEIPVSAKLRLGWDDPSDILENVEYAVRGGAAWVTLHARTRMQGYQPPVFWEMIGKVRESVDVPVVANGDIWELDTFKRCQEITGCEHFMLGRGALADPFLALKIQLLSGLPVKPNLEVDEEVNWFKVMTRFAEIAQKNLTVEDYERYIVKRIKQWLKYTKMKNQQMKKDLPVFEILKTQTRFEDVLRTLQA